MYVYVMDFYFSLITPCNECQVINNHFKPCQLFNKYCNRQVTMSRAFKIVFEVPKCVIKHRTYFFNLIQNMKHLYICSGNWTCPRNRHLIEFVSICQDLFSVTIDSALPSWEFSHPIQYVLLLTMFVFFSNK